MALVNESIELIEKKYPNQWLLIRVTNEDKLGNPVRGSLIHHSKNKNQVINKSKQLTYDVALFYSGSIPKKGYAFCF